MDNSKTYEEIVAMATDEWYPWTDTIAELNTKPEDYYNTFDWLWYMSYVDWDWAETDWIAKWLLNNNIFIKKSNVGKCLWCSNLVRDIYTIYT